MMSTRESLLRKTAEPSAHGDAGVEKGHDGPTTGDTASAEIRTERRSANRPFSGKPKGRRGQEAGHDVASLKALLDERFEPGRADEFDEPLPEIGPAKTHDAKAESPAWRWGGRIIKTLIGLAVLIVVGVMPAQRLMQISSVEAVLNAPLVTVRAPIGGVVTEVSGEMRAGRQIAAHGPLLKITNPRADISRVVAYSDRLESLQREQTAKAARLDAFKELEAQLEGRVGAFTSNRILQLEARQEQADARIGGAEAAFEKARATRQRVSELNAKGLASAAELETAERDATIAEQTVRQLRAERNELDVEMNALRQGTFLGDDYNDRPQSAQRLDEVQSTIAGLKADLKAGEIQIDWAKTTLEEERRRYDAQSSATLDAPVAGPIWQVLATPGEQVEAGEPLLNILDCSKLLVTAVVSESVYNHLLNGTPAAFRFREGGDSLRGRVILLSGMATASSDLAITPAALTREAYRVTVSLDNPFASQGICSIGRTGRVVFGRDAL